MLRVVAICAVALGCHLIAASDSDIKDDAYLINETFVEEFTSPQPEVEPRSEDEEEDQKEQSVCSQPPDIDGVISPDLESEEYPVGFVISYQCKFGYVSRSSGSLLSICRLNTYSGTAEWTHPNTTCIPRSCGDPGYVVNGRRIGNLFTFPNKVKFECLEGYKLQGLKDRYCQASGEWSGRLPACVPIYCPVPPNPQNGRVTYTSLDYGTELEYECDKGFTLQNHQPRICNEDGIWSNDEPECIETRCRVPDAPQHGSVQLYDEPPKVGSLVFYSCDDGATLVGASTSKCLSSGDWTFDPPKCLRSCHVPEIQDGKLGRIQWKNLYRQEFISLQVGESVKHHEIVTIRCNDGYSPGNRTSGSSQEVECNDGAWSEPLHCYSNDFFNYGQYSFDVTIGKRAIFIASNRKEEYGPFLYGSLAGNKCYTIYTLKCKRNFRKSFACVLCTGEPPPVENSSPQIPSRMHGSTIWYKCDPGYGKAKTGGVSCQYGKWEGITPVCSDYRCQMKELNYPGLVKPQMDFINHGEQFSLVCGKAYKAASRKKHVTCFKGKWDIRKYPCIIKTCEEEPPLLKNGKPREFARTNGSFIDYECEEGYELEGHSSVHCEFGAWVGQLPDCKSSVANLLTTAATESENNSTAAKSSDLTGDALQPEECFCTYDFKNDLLRVFWREEEIESHYRIKKGEKVSLSCRYPSMDIVWPNGLRIFERMELICDRCQDWQMQDLPQCDQRITGDSFFVYDSSLKLLPGGIIEVSPSERVTLICVNPWVQPKWNITRMERISLQSNLLPTIETGFFREDLVINEMEYEHVGRHECFAVYGQKLRSTVIDLKIDGFEVLCPELSTETNQGSFEITYSNKRKVHSTAHYTCKDPLKKIVGPSERICQENGKWSRSFPACEDIRCPLLNENNVFLITYSISNRKVNSVAHYHCKTVHQRLIGSRNRTCLHSGEWSGTNPVCEDIICPEFRTYNGLSVTYSRGRKIGSMASFNCINHATLVGNPAASCLYNGTWSHSRPSCEMLEIHCPKIDGKGIFTIKYSNNRKINSTAQFFCIASNKKVSGCNFMTCQQNGEWSGDYPTCVDYVTCDSFAASPNLNIHYTDGDRVGSVASFQCLPPTSLVGSSYARCRSNGTWSHSLPTCAAPDCSIDDLETSLSETLHPILENVTGEFVTPGTEIPLICEEHFVLTGSSKALCNSLGKWESTDGQCISVCRVNKDEASHLIVEPMKDYYRFGEFILLSCPPGQKLTSDVERMMCLGRTWSDTLPDCAEMTEPNLSGFTQTTT